MKKITAGKIAILIMTLLLLPGLAFSQNSEKLNRIAGKRILKWESRRDNLKITHGIKPDSVNLKSDTVKIFFPVSLSYQPFREEYNASLSNAFKGILGRKFRRFDVSLYSDGIDTRQLIPNIYRKETPADSSRIMLSGKSKPVFMTRLDKEKASAGLDGDIIALWHSHGYYYDQSLDRWEWQRAKLFGTVEDIYVMGYVLPFLTPMLENAGATVFLPRERDIQNNEVIVDNDRSSGGSEFVLQIPGNVIKTAKGFLITDTIFTGVNPFRRGTSLIVKDTRATYTPDFPSKGEYAVYISYPAGRDNSRKVRYTVTHAGGKTSFIVDQTMGGETWIYLGTFLFDSGKDAEKGAVEVSADDGGYTGLDAIRFGGGMGNVARKPAVDFLPNVKSINDGHQTDTGTSADSTGYSWKISGKPRYLEGARYFLQYAGMPDSLVYSPNFNKNDYNDDYQSRGYWVNYLASAATGEAGSNDVKGLGLPVDLAFAFHTDAGVTPDSIMVGTLGIYSTAGDQGRYPDGVSRMAGRDYADIIQSQVVNDISALYHVNWTRRDLWDKPYSEAKKPDVPVMLMELLSHQNLADQRFGLDPRFRFTVSRAVYKGMLRFLAYNYHKPYIVEPLPVKNMSMNIVGGKTIRLSWQPVTDPLEPTAKPDRFRVYTRTDDQGFDNGVIVSDTSTVITLGSFNTIYSFKVTAVNDGGESFPSEILSAGFTDSQEKPVLIVNAFDRISGPAWFDKDGMAGIAWWEDRGVPYKYDISALGDQYDFNRNDQWLTDDDPGWGASYSDMVGKVIPGNTFDYPYIHGKAVMNAGRSFISVSCSAFSADSYNAEGFDAVDIILGEQKSMKTATDRLQSDFRIYTPMFIRKLTLLTEGGKNILITGSYVGSEIVNTKDAGALKFASSVLHFKPGTGHAVREGGVYPTDYVHNLLREKFIFNTGNNPGIYAAEAPDAIEPASKQSVIALRYSESNSTAAVLFSGSYKTVVAGFPFETIIGEESRNNLMKQILDFFNSK